MTQFLGRHLLVEFLECDSTILNSVHQIEKAMNEAALKAGATIVSSTFHHFSPYGVSGVVVIAESHLAIHTWPEHGYASVDLYTCGNECDPHSAMEFLKEVFSVGRIQCTELKRGTLDTDGKPLLHKPVEASVGPAVSID